MQATSTPYPLAGKQSSARPPQEHKWRGEGLRGLRGLDDHHIVVMAGVPLQALAPHADLIAHEFISELERIQPVAGYGSVAQSDYRASKDGFEFVLQRVERVQRGGMCRPLADIENGGRQLAGLLRRNPGYLGVDSGKNRTDDAEGCHAQIQKIAVAVHERLGVVVDIFGGALV